MEKKEVEKICSKGFRRYQKSYGSVPAKVESRLSARPNCTSEGDEYAEYVEERFGRNLAASFIDSAKLAIRKRICGFLKANLCLEAALQREHGVSDRGVEGLTVDDVYLYPCGMSAIFNTHRMILSVFGPKKSVCYG